jgi:hypothetical protein
MADTGIFCTGTEVQRKAGTGASSTAVAEAYLNDFISEAESFINCACRKNYSDLYTSLNADVKGTLKLAASALAAIMVINYDMAGYPSREHAETMCDILKTLANECIAILMDKNTETFVTGA